MAAKAAYELAEAREMLNLCKSAMNELVSGQAKSYRIGTREFTAFDIDELLRLIRYYSDLVASLEGQVRSNSVARVVFRDL